MPAPSHLAAEVYVDPVQLALEQVTLASAF